jgi:glycerol kinase
MQNKLITLIKEQLPPELSLTMMGGKYFSKPFEQIFPKPGWVEHDQMRFGLLKLVALQKLSLRYSGREIAAIGITNQRETTIVWDRETSKPLYNAMVWQDHRTTKYL